MGAPQHSRRLLLAAAGLALGVGLVACGSDGPPKNADLVAGKKKFVQKCGSCHALKRANTSGKQGPDLDAAFAQSLSAGFGRSSVRGAVRHQILYPARIAKATDVAMPAKIVTGKDADNVAAYVADVVARPGKDAGLLAEAVQAAGAGKPVIAKGGKLELPADPNGQLAYITKQAKAKPGQLEIDSKNASSTPHDIALTGNGVNEKGKVVQNGGVSTVKASVKPGKYQFYCTVPGHKEGGMAGTLTVK
ncbi:MAG: plastocyanin/azurin family copper-binding protein [Actinomycetota bacterium]|nr:plastocyanin/azurin family copper-binding protein [Actinomycetota bacterium]